MIKSFCYVMFCTRRWPIQTRAMGTEKYWQSSDTHLHSLSKLPKRSSITPCTTVDPKTCQNKLNVPQQVKQEKVIAMMAPEENNIKISSNPLILSGICNKKYLWLIDSAAFKRYMWKLWPIQENTWSSTNFYWNS